MREEQRMQMEYSAKMDAEEEKKRAEMRKVQDRQVSCYRRRRESNRAVLLHI